MPEFTGQDGLLGGERDRVDRGVMSPMPPLQVGLQGGERNRVDRGVRSPMTPSRTAGERERGTAWTVE